MPPTPCSCGNQTASMLQELVHEMSQVVEHDQKFLEIMRKLREENSRIIKRMMVSIKHIEGLIQQTDEMLEQGEETKKKVHEAEAAGANLDLITGYRLEDVKQVGDNLFEITIYYDATCYVKYIYGSRFDLIEVFPKPLEFDSIKEHLQTTQDFRGVLDYLVVYFKMVNAPPSEEDADTDDGQF